MASVYELKPRFQDLLRPTVRRLAGWGVTANAVTWAGVALSLVVAAALAWGRPGTCCWLALPPALLLRMALNAADGMLAREFGMTSPFGTILNELGDVVCDAALVLPFATLPGVDAVPVLACAGLAALTEIAGLAAVPAGASRRYDGPMGKSDRALVFGLLGMALGMGARPGRWLGAAVLVVCVLLAFTVANRVRLALAEAGGPS
ncbi:MAG: CDP-alcohol phosphatidyltransferase family protein [Elusimicrobia bacterium]|nr:CDP-alcohol phosphatidyltransferase family protein [Elusimicrobiota bacterium]